MPESRRKKLCPLYADVVVAALAPAVANPPGDPVQVCTYLFAFVTAVDKAATSMHLLLGAPAILNSRPVAEDELPSQHTVPQAQTMYGIATAVQGAPLLEVNGEALANCMGQMQEIMFRERRSARDLVHMTRDWCARTAGSRRGSSRQDCHDMALLASFAVRDVDGVLTAREVCDKFFLSMTSVHRVDQMVRTAWMSVSESDDTQGFTSRGIDQ